MAQLVLDGYDPGSFYCEMLRGNSAGLIRERIGALSVDALHFRVAKAELYKSRHHLHRLLRAGRGGPHPALRRDPARALRR